MSSHSSREASRLIENFLRQKGQGQDVVDDVLTQTGIVRDPATRAALIAELSRHIRDSASAAAAQAAGDASRGHPLPEIPGYDLIEEVGRGGMGVVYEGYQQSTGRRVAVKFISAHVAASDAVRR